MNISQTQQVLSYIWSTHPSAPKYSDDGKTRIIASYFRVLYRFDVQDVFAAVDAACRESSTFIPSAYEIEAKCEKRVDVERHLGDEYREAALRLEDADARRNAFEPEYRRAFDARAALLANIVWDSLDNDIKEEMEATLAPLDAVIERYYDLAEECRQLKARKDELHCRASWEACDAYDREQARIAHNDLCKLGYGQLALE